MQLTPEWLAFEEKLGSRPNVTGTYEEMRTTYKGLSDMLAAQDGKPADPSVHRREEIIYGGLKLAIYTPREVHELGEKVPLGIYAHGGGLVCGGMHTFFEDRLCRYIAQHASCILVAVNYRLAPEYPTPTQLYDYVGGYNWAWDNCESLGGLKDYVFAIGASAGGTLALGGALKMLEYGLMTERVRGVVSLAPITIHPDHVPDKYRASLKAWEENRWGPVVDLDALKLFWAINGGNGQKASADSFVALHDRLSELPPTYIATCGADCVRDDGTIIKEELDKAGVPCKLENYEALPHFFWIFPEIKAGDDFRRNSAAAVKWVLSQKKKTKVNGVI